MAFFTTAILSALASGQVLNTIYDFFKRARNIATGGKENSLIDVAQAARVEPLCVVDSDCVNLEYGKDVSRTMLDLFSGYYLQALSWCIEPASIRVLGVLNELNPNRDPSPEIKKLVLKAGNAAINTAVSGFITESYQEKGIGGAPKADWRMAHESYQWRLPTTTNKVAMACEEEYIDSISASVSKDTGDASSLAVGKVISATFSQGNAKISLPIAIRMMTMTANTSLVAKILSGGGDKNIGERIHMWKSGAINFWSDLVMCQDMIDEQKKLLAKDKSGTIAELTRRSNNVSKSTWTGGVPALGAASNLFVISEATARQIEADLGGKFTNATVRDKIFTRSHAMIIAVIDRQAERVNFYYRGMSAFNSLGIRDIKNSKGGGDDVGSVLKAFMLGQTPL